MAQTGSSNICNPIAHWAEPVVLFANVIVFTTSTVGDLTDTLYMTAYGHIYNMFRLFLQIYFSVPYLRLQILFKITRVCFGNSGLITPYDLIELDQHWIRFFVSHVRRHYPNQYWLVVNRTNFRTISISIQKFSFNKIQYIVRKMAAILSSSGLNEFISICIEKITPNSKNPGIPPLR